MSAFLYGILLQWKLNFRNKEIVVTYYVVPLIFYLFMGFIFTSIIPDAYKTLIQSMSIFGVTMGGCIGLPTTLVEFYGSDMKKTFRSGNIPIWTAAAGNFLSGVLHLFIMCLIIFFTAPILFKASVPSNIPFYFVTLLLSIMAGAGVGTVLGLYANNTGKLTMFSQFVFLPSIILSGIMFPAQMLPKFLVYIGKIFPATWSFSAMCESQPEIKNLLPLSLIIVLLLILSIFKIQKLKKD